MRDKPEGGVGALSWWSLVALMTVASVGSVSGAATKTRCYESRMGPNIHNFTLTDIHGAKNTSLRQHAGKVMLIVNVASFWGATPQYLTLNALYHRFSNLEIIANPCNQFGLQEPGANATEILNSLQHVRPGSGFKPSFPLFQKIDVNGENEHPMYTFLKSRCPPPTKGFSTKEKLFYAPFHADDIRWNFEKFLVDCKGEPVSRYAAGFSPENMVEDIQLLLNRCMMDQQ